MRNRPIPRLFKYFILLLFGILATGQVYGFDTIQLAQKVAASLHQGASEKYSTIAFSRIQGALNQDTVNELIDFTENEIVQGRRFRLIDRSKLQLILREQKFNLTGMVSQDTYKTLGKLLGVDLFIYGHYYGDTIVFKAIDVESSAIAWADVFPLKQLSKDSVTLNNLTGKVADSLRGSLTRLKGNRIKQISFWSIETDFDSDKVVDYLSAALTRDGNFQVVDRENLQLILEEQKLNRADFIDEKKAKRMGELYGVDAFIYGRITTKPGQHIASLKMLNIYTGVIEWANTIRFSDQAEEQHPTGKRSQQSDSEMVYVAAGAFIMGSNEGDGISSPALKVPLPAFFIDRTEVSNSAYEKFVTRFKHRSPPSWPGGRIPAGKEDLPVVQVNWNDARRYCLSMGKRLPKEAEWEKALRGVDGQKYPWSGNSFYPSYARTVESGVLAPEPVSTSNKDISPYEVQHLAGNVREWVDSFLVPYPGSKYRLQQKGFRGIRGGSWAKTKDQSVGWFRDASNPNYGWDDVGFRCARSAR